MQEIRNAFHERRLAMGMTQAQVAERAALARKTVSDFENGRASISTGNLVRLLASVGLELAVRERARRPTLDELQQRLETAEQPDAAPRARRARGALPR